MGCAALAGDEHAESYPTQHRGQKERATAQKAEDENKADGATENQQLAASSEPTAVELNGQQRTAALRRRGGLEGVDGRVWADVVRLHQASAACLPTEGQGLDLAW